MLRVLVVDDNRDAADTIALLIKLWGHENCVAYDGMAALKAASQFHPDIVLLDFRMPGMNGGEVGRRLHAVPGQDRPVIVATTATAMEDIKSAGYDGVFDLYIPKPYDLDEFERLLTGRATRPAPASATAT